MHGFDPLQYKPLQPNAYDPYDVTYPLMNVTSDIRSSCTGRDPYELAIITMAVNEPDEYGRSLVHVLSFNFSRTNKRTRSLKRTNFLVDVSLLRK